MSLFLRDYRLIVGVPSSQTPDVLVESFLLSGNFGRYIKDLQLRFNIVRSATATQNKAKFEIFNLAPPSRAAFETSDDETNNPVIIFQVRYLYEPRTPPSDGFQTLFTGRVIQALTTKEGPDMVTQVEAGDGYVPLRDGVTARNFPRGTSRRTVLLKLVQDLGVPVGEIRDGGALDQRFENGTTWEGPIRIAIDSLLSPVNMEWSIQDDAFTAVRSDLSSLEQVLDLTAKTGLINSPRAKKAKANTMAGSLQTPDHGVIIESLLTPALKPNRRVKVTSEAYPKGQIFKVAKVTHKGDFRGQEWSSKAECVETNDPLTDETTEGLNGE